MRYKRRDGTGSGRDSQTGQSPCQLGRVCRQEIQVLGLWMVGTRKPTFRTPPSSNACANPPPFPFLPAILLNFLCLNQLRFSFSRAVQFYGTHQRRLVVFCNTPLLDIARGDAFSTRE